MSETPAQVATNAATVSGEKNCAFCKTHVLHHAGTRVSNACWSHEYIYIYIYTRWSLVGHQAVFAALAGGNHRLINHSFHFVLLPSSHCPARLSPLTDT